VASRRSRRPTNGARDAGAQTRLVYSTASEVPAAGPPPSPAPPRSAGPVRLRLERRASDRVVTVLTGLPGTPEQVAELARELRSACGAGGTVRADAIELQGDQRDKAAAALLARGRRVKR
jgi:translation initiation factor 1